MIQRIQSILMLGVAICQSLLFATALATFNGYNSSYNLSIFGFYKTTVGGEELLLNNYALMFVNLIIIIFSTYIIFNFKNRRLQMKLAGFNVLLISAFIVLMFFNFDNTKSFIALANSGADSQLKTTYGIGMVLPILAIILSILAIRAIKKDDDLVKSADRIR